MVSQIGEDYISQEILFQEDIIVLLEIKRSEFGKENIKLIKGGDILK